MRSAAAPRVLTPSAVLPSEVADGSTRGRILEVALRRFAVDGYHSTSIRDLAGELELQPSALYAHFPSKEHVLAELVRVGHDLHHRALSDAVVQGGSDPVDQMRALVRAHVLFHTRYSMLAVVINDEMHSLSSDLASAGLALRRLSVHLLSDVVERGVAQRRFHPPHALVTINAIGGMGLRVAHWYRPDFELDPEALAGVHEELALRMLGVR